MYDVRSTRYDLKIPARCAKGFSEKQSNTLPREPALQHRRHRIPSESADCFGIRLRIRFASPAQRARTLKSYILH